MTFLAAHAKKKKKKVRKRKKQTEAICSGCRWQVTLESAAETTYPVPEQISGGVILLLSQVFGVLETYAYGWLLPDDAEFETELKGSVGEGPNHSNHSNHSNSFEIGIFRNFSLENSKISENFNIF